MPARLHKEFWPGYMSKWERAWTGDIFFIISITCFSWSYACPKYLVPICLLVHLDMVNMEVPSIEHNGYFCGRNPTVETLSLSPLPYFTIHSLEEDIPPVFSLDVGSQIVSKVLLTLNLRMSSMDGVPKSNPNPTRAADVVTPPNLWWCTTNQNLCISTKPLTLDPHTSTLSSYLCLYLLPAPV